MQKGRHRFAVMFDDTEQGRRLAREQAFVWAANPLLSFSWENAAVLCNKINDSTERQP
jgi:hypothetical protein